MGTVKTGAKMTNGAPSAVKEHSIEDSNSEAFRCFHCSQEHQTGNFKCIEYKYQQEIIAIQTRESLTIKPKLA